MTHAPDGPQSLDALLALTQAGDAARWNFPAAAGTPRSAPGGLGQPASVTYSFMTAVPAYAEAESRNGFAPLGEAGKAAARSALALYAEAANLRFVEVPDDGAGGQIRFGTHAMTGKAGYAYFPAFGYGSSGSPALIERVTEIPVGGDVWLNAGVGDRTPGGYGYLTMLHEIGHALGLKHPFKGTATLPAGQDNHAWTVMSYTASPGSGLTAVTGGPPGWSWTSDLLAPRTPMLLDVAAVQHLYGANTATRGGDTVYAWRTSEAFFETIWDGGGTDTIDLSNQTLACTVDLQPGRFSSIAMRRTPAELRADLPDWAAGAPTPSYNGTGNLAIAAGVLIENAVGGAGNDRLSGNDAGNRLQGGPGDDTLEGGAGDDTLLGGSGSDRAVFAFASDAAALRFDGADLLVAGPDGTDRLREVETLVFTDRSLAAGSLTGPAAASEDPGRRALVHDAAGSREVRMAPYVGPVAWLRNEYLGGGGGEAVIGGGDADFMNLLGGDDAAQGVGGDDVLDGGTGSNFLTGGDGADTFFVDGRAGVTWSTVTDLQPAEWAIAWGWEEGTSRLDWAEAAGADGWRGATAHIDLDGNGTTDTSLTFTGRAAGSVAVLPGRVDGTPYLSFRLS